MLVLLTGIPARAGGSILGASLERAIVPPAALQVRTSKRKVFIHISQLFHLLVSTWLTLLWYSAQGKRVPLGGATGCRAQPVRLRSSTLPRVSPLHAFSPWLPGSTRELCTNTLLTLLTLRLKKTFYQLMKEPQ
jgi:hypothetical protein